MVYGLRSMVSVWCRYGLVAYGLWSKYGLWSVSYGLWSIVCGLWFMVYVVYGLWRADGREAARALPFALVSVTPSEASTLPGAARCGSSRCIRHSAPFSLAPPPLRVSTAVAKSTFRKQKSFTAKFCSVG